MTDPSLAPACHLCGAPSPIAVDAFRGLKQVTSDCRPWGHDGNIVVCAKCATVQKSITQSWRDAADKIYSEYRIYVQGGGAEQHVFDLASGADASRSSRLVSRFVGTTALPPRGRLLDVGCGNGALLRAFSAAMPGWTLAGLELSDRHRAEIERIPGVEALYVGGLGSVPAQFDIIAMVHCLEHITDPVVFLRDLRGKFSAGGRLLIEVPELSTNPFDLLIADHCTHFDAHSLRRVIQAAGFEVESLSNEWVVKELSVVARFGDAVGELAGAEPPAVAQASELVRHYGRWLSDLLHAAKQCGPGSVGIFGTSIAATWLAQHLDGRVAFFVDEDANRIGGSHLGLPVLAPRAVERGARVVVPLPRMIAERIATRLSPLGINFALPPELSAPGNAARPA